MQAPISVPRRQFNLLLWAIVALGVGVLSLLPIKLLRTDSTKTPSLVDSRIPRVAYFEFDTTADTLWLASASDPTKRQKLFAIAHAEEFGIVPSLAPDRAQFAYNALPVSLSSPSPDSPAEVWVGAISTTEKPKLVAHGVDLLVPPVWSPKSDELVYRRSDDYRLFILDIASGEERELVSGDGWSLFPVGFTPDGGRLYYVKITNDDSSLLAVNLNDGSSIPVAKLADGLTRDWRLSPTGDRLAYLAMGSDSTQVVSRAYILDIASGAATQTGPDGDAFSPAWSKTGELAVGSISGTGKVSATQNGFTKPSKGFDVPLVFDKTGGQLVVRNFDGTSAVNPGRERLEIVSAGGTRKTITNDEVTFLGWIDP